jgi:hypothetical protein
MQYFYGNMDTSFPGLVQYKSKKKLLGLFSDIAVGICGIPVPTEEKD